MARRQLGKLVGVKKASARTIAVKAPPDDNLESGDALRLLRADIISGALQPGSRLRFAELQARYRLGTSPLREALSRLAADRLVVQEINRGFHIPKLSLEDFSDIARLRVELECSAIEASIARGGDAWEEAVVLAHYRLKRLDRRSAVDAEGPVSDEWEICHRAFHTALIAACDSPWRLHFCEVLHNQFDRYRRWVGRDPAVQENLTRQHQLILDAVIARDAAGASALLTEHIGDTASMVASRLERLR